MAFNPDFLESKSEDAQVNQLLKYLQHQSPEVLAQVAKSTSHQVKDIISHNIQGLLGMLPIENFNVQITTDRENLASLLGSAMMTGYFLRQMEQRMELEEMLTGSGSLDTDRDPTEF
jgi:23S rRNA G2069 N7-methylase RlmK/C1962 C5-methylase RlmI